MSGSCFLTCWAVVGLNLPNLFALGAAIGHWANSINLRAIALSGILIATVGKPEVTISWTCLLFGRTIVNGPGQKCFAINGILSSEYLQTCSRSSILLICTIRGSKEGRSFWINIRATASALNAFAPNP